jgi:hypothetical protein
MGQQPLPGGNRDGGAMTDEAMCIDCGEEPASTFPRCRDCDIEYILEMNTCKECRRFIYRRDLVPNSHADGCSKAPQVTSG